MTVEDHINDAAEIAKHMMADMEKPYHNQNHAEDVRSAGDQLCNQIGVSGHVEAVVYLSAWFHDVGHYYGAENHEQKSAEIAEAHLQAADLDHRIVEDVKMAVLDTDPNRSPGSFLPGQIISDADFYSFGMPFKMFRKLSLLVRDEENPEADDEWWLSNRTLPLMKDHEWETDAARERWDEQKKRNQSRIEKQITE